MTGIVESSSAGADEAQRDAVQRRTMRTLVGMQAAGNAAIASVVAVSSLLASDLLGGDTLAGFGGATLTAGAAFIAVPWPSTCAATVGGRGSSIGLRASPSSAASPRRSPGRSGWFPLFLLGTFLIGTGQGANLAGRYAAADLARPEHRARAISIVVWTGTIGAVLGPTLATRREERRRQRRLQPPDRPLCCSAGRTSSWPASLVWMFMRPDPLVVAGGLAPVDEPRVRRVAQARGAFGVIRRSAGARLGLLAMVISQTSMVAVMTMTPLHMKDHGQSDLSALVIALHIVGHVRAGAAGRHRRRPRRACHGSSRAARRSSASGRWSRSSPATTRCSSSPGCSCSAWGGAAA